MRRLYQLERAAETDIHAKSDGRGVLCRTPGPKGGVPTRTAMIAAVSFPRADMFPLASESTRDGGYRGHDRVRATQSVADSL